MSDLVQHPSFLLASRAEREKGREVERIRRQTDITKFRRNAEIDVIESVTESALFATAHISALEAHLMARVPEHTRARLACVSDGGALAMATVVARLAKS
jgi:alpha-ketoglutarate-dependent taurine dioxygenase